MSDSVMALMTTEQDTPSGGISASSEAEIRWTEATAFVRRRLGYEMPSTSREHIDDLVQEALVRLLRVVRRERVDNLEALMTEIARRTAIDCLRRRTRWKAVLTPETPATADVADPKAKADTLGDPIERLHFVVLEFFTVREARCRDLAVAFFAEQDWKVVADAQGRSHDAVRKQWSRCLEMLRMEARGDRGILAEWAEPQ